MDAGGRGLAVAAGVAPWNVKIRRTMVARPLLPPSRGVGFWWRGGRVWSQRPHGVVLCRGDSSEFQKLRQCKGAAAAAAAEKADEWRLEVKKSARRVRMQALPPLPFPSTRLE